MTNIYPNSGPNLQPGSNHREVDIKGFDALLDEILLPRAIHRLKEQISKASVVVDYRGCRMSLTGG